MNVVHHVFDGLRNNVIQNGEGVKVSIAPEILLKRMMFGGYILILTLGFSYLMILNSLATNGFDLEVLKKESLGLKKQVEAIDIELAIPSSLYALESFEQVQGMEDVKRKSFMVLEEGEVAMIRTLDVGL